jgi:hypothetical protein
MHKLYFILFFGIIGLMSCNSNGSNSGSADTVASAKATDTAMKHSADTVKSIMALPPVPIGAKVYFKNLRNNEVVKSPFKVIMGVKNIKVDSAGFVVAGEGHHHILIDAGDSVAAGEVIPKDAQHLHFGKGQTSATIELPKGKHRLTLQFADGIHRSYGSKLSATIEITVK